MKHILITLSTMLLTTLITLPAQHAQAFCGFYVSGATDKLYNNATQVVMMRSGETTVLSMRNNYQGPPKDFAMVVPVPVVLKEEQVKTLPDSVFAKVDALAAPRLVEYWEQNPCPKPVPSRRRSGRGFGKMKKSSPPSMNEDKVSKARPAVVVEAKFKAGEYNVVVLSATESNALETWLRQHKYNIPTGAAKMLQGYVQQGMYFFVARVDVKKVKFDKKGQALLSPLRFYYDSKDFSLPVRLGLLNAKGKQDLIVHVLAKNKRYEAANYKNTTIPTNLIVSKSVKRTFSEFYASLLDYTMNENPGAVVTEYSWQSTKCDPCPSGNFGGRRIGGPLNYNDLRLLGLDIMHKQRMRYQFNISENAHMLAGPPHEPKGFHILRHTIFEQTHRCAFERLDPSQKSSWGNLTVQMNVEPNGTAIRAVVQGNNPKHTQPVVSCLQERLNTLPGALLKQVRNASAYSFSSTISLNSRAYFPRQWQATQDWVLTRLHARYDAKTFKDDLVFKAARPIVGGRGTPTGPKAKLPEEGSKFASSNNFQGRYIMLNTWKGAITCKNPRRGRWGYPPRGRWNIKPALDTAFAPRGKFRLKKAIRSKNAPGLKFTKK